MTFQAILSPAQFSRAMYAQSIEETRFYLKGVFVEPAEEGATLTATDGNLLISAHDAAAHVVGGSAIVSLAPELAKRIRAKDPRAGARLLLVSGQRAAVYEGAVSDDPAELHTLIALVDAPDERIVAYQPHGALVDGSFPDWRRVVPHGEVQPLSTTYDAHLLDRIGSALATDRKAPLRLVGKGRDATDANASPALAFGAARDAFGIIMPIRWNDDRDTAPSWIAQKAA